ncbi:HTH-type transcriptional regulator MalT [compost metagenome]
MVQAPSTPSRSFELPRLAADHLSRPRLRDALLQADCRLRLLCAPAGSGKSVLLGECMRRCPAETRLIYLDLRGKPLAAASLLQLLANGLGVEPSEPSGIEQACVEQLNEAPGPLWLVLDDYPRAPDEELDRCLNNLIQAAPQRVYWWIASRRRPGLQLSRLLLDGELFELGASELAFDIDELRQLLQNKRLDYSGPAIDRLHQDSQGWIAGIRLQLLNPGHGQASPGLAHDDPRLLDYLQNEVLDALPEDWRQALQTLALLPHFDAALCEQLLGIGEGVQRLKQLSDCGLFIEPAGPQGQVFRVQPLVARALAGQLPAVLVKAVFRQACQWYIGQDKVRLALEYAVKAGQLEVAASLMQRYSEDALLQGRSLAQLMEWRRELPEELLSSSPRLVLLNAWALLLSGRLDEAEHYSDQLACFTPQPTASRQRGLIAQWKALKANLAFHRGAAEQARILLAEAIAELPERAWSQRLFCCALQVEQAMGEGHLDQAQELNRAAIKQAREQASLALESVMLLGHVKLLEIRGELLRAETLLKRLYSELSNAWSDEPSPMRGRVQLRRAALLMQQGRYEEASSAFHAGQQESLACGDPAAFWGYLGLAELDALLGDPASAFWRIAEAERFAQCNHINEAVYQGLLLRAKARLWLGQGRAAHTEKALLGRLDFPPYGAPDLCLRLSLLHLQARLATGNVEEAVNGLGEFHAKALSEGRRPLACEAAFSLAESLYAWNKPAQAKQALLGALALARQLGLTSVESAFALRSPALMRWAGTTSAHSEPAPLLSRRELEVLKLIVRGHSNQQIAEQLFISLHTVKTHAQRINFKFAVERRTQAVARAKELGLG